MITSTYEEASSICHLTTTGLTGSLSILAPEVLHLTFAPCSRGKPPWCHVLDPFATPCSTSQDKRLCSNQQPLEPGLIILRTAERNKGIDKAQMIGTKPEIGREHWKGRFKQLFLGPLVVQFPKNCATCTRTRSEGIANCLRQGRSLLPCSTKPK